MKLYQLMGVAALSVVPVIANASAFSVQELPVSDLSLNQFGSHIDNSGLILTTLNNPFNPPIDMTLFDVDLFPSLTDPEAAAQGNFNIIDYTQVVNAYRQIGVSLTPFGQKLANQVLYQTDGTDVEYVFGFDQEQDSTNGFTFALNTSLGGSTNGAYIVGSSPTPFYPVTFTSETGTEITAVISDVLQRGFVQFAGQVTPLLPIDETLGGFSRADAINQNLQVAGTSSVEARQNIIDGIAACNSDANVLPIEICLYELTVNSRDQFVRRATVWQLDAQGQVLSTQAYGLDFTPEVDDPRNFVNEAFDINNSGVAVGTGNVLVGNNATTAAMVFENGLTSRLIPEDDRLPNFAIGINDSNVIVGYQIQGINNQGRAKFFTYDLNTDTLTFPTDFFVSSSTFPRDINNNGLIVGDAEVDATQGQRRREAFMYNIQSDEFVNLNDLIACDSPYTLVAANSINDSNEIVADATVLRSLRNIRGEPIVDADGNEVLETTVVALKLTPTGGEAPDCSLDQEEDVETERQGASNSVLFLLVLGFFAGFRRFKR